MTHYYTTTSNLTTTTGGSLLGAWTETTTDDIDWVSYKARIQSLTNQYRSYPHQPVTAPKADMKIPEPKSCECPKCNHRAIKSAEGHDWTLDITDHDVTRTEGKNTAKENGNRARLRICADCGNVWATILRTEEK